MVLPGATPRPGALPEAALRSGPSTARLLAGYGLGALTLLWPALSCPGRLLPGAARSDLWNSLWSLWFVQSSLAAGRMPLHTALLGFPDGGRLFVADPVNDLLGAPLVPLAGVPGAYLALVFAHLVLSAWAAHRLAEALVGEGSPAAWLAGFAYQAAPIVLSAFHGGTSEAIGAGWLPLALLTALAVLRHGGIGRGAAAGLALALAGWGNWYYGITAFIGVGVLLVVGEGEGSWRARALRLGPPLLLGAALCAPLAWLQGTASIGADNLVGIKGLAEVAILRRTTGPADPLAYLLPWSYRSPDFRLLSRYGEDFVHCPYLGWVLLVLAGAGLSRSGRRRGLWLAIAAAVAGLLSLGPVLVHHGSALLLPGDRVVPLPYLALERLPGFDRLSLLFRFGLLPALGAAVLAADGLARIGGARGRWVLLATLLAVGELRLLSPLHGLPAWSEVPDQAPFRALARAHPGAVMNFPVVGGRPYLYEQTLHGKPLTGGLNFTEGGASRAVWRALITYAPRAAAEPEVFAAAVRAAACSRGIGYLVLHDDTVARPDQHAPGAAAARARLPVLVEGEGVQIVELCPGGSG
ncbi:MAG: hypothetical protein ABIO70_22935 [Pseudomonadota bacterium]